MLRITINNISPRTLVGIVVWPAPVAVISRDSMQASFSNRKTV